MHYLLFKETSVETEMWMSIFHIINFKKKNRGHRGHGFLNKKLIYYFCLKSGPVFLFQIFIIAPLPRDIKLYH